MLLRIRDDVFPPSTDEVGLALPVSRHQQTGHQDGFHEVIAGHVDLDRVVSVSEGQEDSCRGMDIANLQ